ncbi:MAG TPA: FAD-dependent monooxygenase [Candidatus Binataceae bacterium]|nr:FAD-dependent monooxygenase [Candidatus Binataceae bacterium]
MTSRQASEPPLSIAIIGAGIGGLATAAALRRIGLAVQVYEQASQFARVGAGIQQSPNAIKVLRGLGLEAHLRAVAFQPSASRNRDFDTGAITNDYPLGEMVEARFGAPYLLLHRGDLHAALATLVPRDIVHLNHRVFALEPDRATVSIRFANGNRASADAVVGADGVHSVVRDFLLGADRPRFTGRVAYRTTFPAARLGGMAIDDSVKWWGPDRHIVMYYVNRRRDEVYFVTSTPEPDFEVESWSAKGDLKILREAYAEFHPQVRTVLAACPEVHKWALVERDPLPRWGEGRVVLLGDACHPMTPYMAQGAATAIEDAAVLSRCLEGLDADGVEAAFRRYEMTRKERTSRIQLTSRANTWMRRRTDADWVYGYDAWHAPLA